MATILIIDDRPSNRHYLTTLLGYFNHQLLEAADGLAALQIVHEQKPDLVITDILMPKMDGYEFVRELRADPSTADMRVLFYTVSYLEPEALALARECGVLAVLPKPGDPAQIIKTVNQALGLPETDVRPPTPERTPPTVELLVDLFKRKEEQVEAVSSRLGALIDVGLLLARERDLRKLPEVFCHSARKVIPSKLAVLGLLDDDERTFHSLYKSGAFDPALELSDELDTPCVRQVLETRRPLRLGNSGTKADKAGRPKTCQRSCLVVPVVSPIYRYGLLYFADKLGSNEFTEEEELLAITLAAQAAAALENLKLFDEIQRHASRLQIEVGERKRAQEELRESEKQFRLLFEKNPYPMWVFDYETLAFLAVNDAALKHYGYSREEFLAMTEADIRIAEQVSALKQHLSTSVWESGKVLRAGEWKHQKKDGSEIVVEISSSLLLFQGRKAHLVLAKDVTEQKKLAAERDRLLDRMKLHVNEMPIAYLLTDADLRYVDWNPAAEKIFGFSKDEVLGKQPFEVTVSPSVRPAVQETFDRLRKGQRTIQRVGENLTKSGRTITCEWHSARLEDVDGTFLGILSMAQDITERKQLEAQLRQAQKLEAVAMLAGGIAHDFNNLLTIISGYTDLALDELEPGNTLRDDIDEIKVAAARATALTRQLLIFSRKQVVEKQLLNLNSVVSGVEKLLHRMIGEDIKLVSRLAPNLGPIRADPGQIEQVIMNLAVNSRDAMPKGGGLSIETAQVQIGEENVHQRTDLQPGSYVMLAVSDTGCGMDDETRACIFEPFFTTKPAEKGTGLGLATVYAIIKDGGGYIEVDSAPGRGSTFRIYLPRVEGVVAQAVETEGRVPAASGNETVLLVEDEDMVRKLARRILEEYGYAVLEASDGPQALEVAQKNEGHIQILVTDIVMPEMRGDDLARTLHRMYPDLKVLYLSGYTDRASEIMESGAPFLYKPFTPDAVARKVREVLDG